MSVSIYHCRQRVLYEFSLYCIEEQWTALFDGIYWFSSACFILSYVLFLFVSFFSTFLWILLTSWNWNIKVNLSVFMMKGRGFFVRVGCFNLILLTNVTGWVQLEVRNSRVPKSSYETELRKMTSQFELLTRKFL